MITIDLQSSTPIHDQIVRELRRLVAQGDLPAGTALPTVRQLAGDLGVHLNTVARAYRELTDAGLLASARGRGTVVISGRERQADARHIELARLRQGLSQALANMKLAGLSAKEVTALVREETQKLWSPTH